MSALMLSDVAVASATTAHMSPGPRVLQIIARRLGPAKYHRWFDHASVGMERGTLVVTVRNRFVASWIQANFRSELAEACRQACGQDTSFEIRVRADGSGRSHATPTRAAGSEGRSVERRAMHPSGATASATKSHARQAASRPLPAANGWAADAASPVFTLESFVVSASNRLAYSAAVKLAEQSSSPGMSPLFIHGGCGLGKTHLLHGICRRFAQTTGRTRAVRYVTGEQFTNEYITAIRGGALDAFRESFRKLELLAIDDVHFLASKVKTQSEFLHTLDAIDLGGARVVLASDEHPRQIQKLSQALISRFLSGMVVQVELPDRAMRETLVRRLAQQRGLAINDAAVNAIAGECIGSVREIQGTINRVAALHDVESRLAQSCGDECPIRTIGEVGYRVAKQALADAAPHAVSPLRMTTIVDCVCRFMQVNRSDVTGTSRHRRVVLSRSLIAYLAREMTTRSFPEIAEGLGRSNHSTIHYADQRLRANLDSDELIEVRAGEPARRMRDLVDALRHEILRVSRDHETA